MRYIEIYYGKYKAKKKHIALYWALFFHVQISLTSN